MPSRPNSTLQQSELDSPRNNHYTPYSDTPTYLRRTAQTTGLQMPAPRLGSAHLRRHRLAHATLLYINALLLEAPLYNQADEQPVAVPRTTIPIQPKSVTTVSLRVWLQGGPPSLFPLPTSCAQTMLANIRTNTLRNLETWKIHPSLRRILLYTVSKRADSDPIPLDNLTDEYTMLMTTQDTICQDSLLLGHFSPTWTILQERYLRAIDEPVGHHQASRGIKALLTQTLEQCHVGIGQKYLA
jgi:hypothetical protein